MERAWGVSLMACHQGSPSPKRRSRFAATLVGALSCFDSQSHKHVFYSCMWPSRPQRTGSTWAKSMAKQSDMGTPCCRRSLTGGGQARAGSQPHGMSPTHVISTLVRARAVHDTAHQPASRFSVAHVCIPFECIYCSLGAGCPIEPLTYVLCTGVSDGITLGTPICVMVPNKDQKSGDYSEMSVAYRPSHADATYDMKYGIRAVRPAAVLLLAMHAEGSGYGMGCKAPCEGLSLYEEITCSPELGRTHMVFSLSMHVSAFILSMHGRAAQKPVLLAAGRGRRALLCQGDHRPRGRRSSCQEAAQAHSWRGGESLPRGAVPIWLQVLVTLLCFTSVIVQGFVLIFWLRAYSTAA